MLFEFVALANVKARTVRERPFSIEYGIGLPVKG